MQVAKWMIRQGRLLLLGSYLGILKQRDTCLIENTPPWRKLQAKSQHESDQIKWKENRVVKMRVWDRWIHLEAEREEEEVTKSNFI